MTPAFAAVDLGASSGRVILGEIANDRLELTEVHRFANEPVRVAGTLHWDILALYRESLTGLGAAAARADLVSAGVDSWGVDYGLLDANGALLANPVHYRDPRTNSVLDVVLRAIPAEQLYARTGIQLLPINTLVQLAAARSDPALRAAETLLLIPDLIGYWLTGVVGAEITNASTTQLLDARTLEWAAELAAGVGVESLRLPPLRHPGDLVGRLAPDTADAARLPRHLPVVAVGSHDTASAVVAVPAEDEEFAYISCGTWSLVGVELDQPIMTEASRHASFTNERGVDGTIRYLRNVMGLWVLQECERRWQAHGWDGGRDSLLREAANLPPLRTVIDVNDLALLGQGDMPARIAARARRSGQPVPTSHAEYARCILESLALAYRRALRDALKLTGRKVRVLHLVGGGARNALLCQLTADSCGVPVLAGPAEATAIGNLLVQARAAGTVTGDRWNLRRLVRATQGLRRYVPRAGGDWSEADGRLSSQAMAEAAGR